MCHLGSVSDTRRHVHELIDRLPPAQLAALASLLEAMLPTEEISKEEESAVNEAKQWLREHGGKGISANSARAAS